jgi:biotin synthase-related radical SAM superfamily protein
MKTIRVSLGSAAALGLKKVRIDCLPTTIYLMTPGKCRAHCLFCSQWTQADHLSRVSWPEFTVEDVVSHLGKNDQRVCIQCLNYEGVFADVLECAERLQDRVRAISVSAHPFSREEIRILDPYIDRISINMDCATQSLFEKIKPYYSWGDHLSTLLYARQIFGAFKAGSHVIVGLGETEEEITRMMSWLYHNELSCSLFAFTPLPGTPLEKKKKPDITYYRRIQAAHYLIYERGKVFQFEDGLISNLDEDIPPEAFITRGCPGCNRPYYTETPRNVYNFPYTPGGREMNLVMAQMKGVE